MIYTSNEVSTSLDADTRNIKAMIKVNGVEMSGYVRPLSIKKGSCGGGSLQPASIYSNSMSAVIYDGAVKKGSKVEVFFSVPESGDSTYYKTFTGYARNSVEKGGELTLDTEGAIAYKLGKEYIGGVGQSINAMLDTISAATGVNIILEDGLDGSYTPNQTAKLDGYLMREVLGYIAGCFFGYATEDESGNIIIQKYRTGAEDSVELKAKRMREFPDVYSTVTVEGIQVFTTNSDGETDFVYPEGIETVNCSIRNPLMTKELFDTYVGNFVGLTYTPFSAEMTLGNFAITPNDCVIVNGKRTMITEITHYYDGGLKTTLSAATLNTGEEYNRTKVEMEADISFAKYPTAESSGGGGDVVIDPVGHYELDTDQNAEATKGAVNVYIKDGYMGVIECIDGGYNGYENGILQNNQNSHIDAKFMPAYPIKICVVGYTNSSGGWSSYLTAAQIDILPELDESGHVKVIASTALLDPKQWNKSWNRYWYNEASMNSLSQYTHHKYRVQYLLKSYVDSLKEEEGVE